MSINSTQPVDRLLTEGELADRHRRSVKTLQNERVKGGGVPFIKIGRSVRYRMDDVLLFEQVSRCLSTSTTQVEGGAK